MRTTNHTAAGITLPSRDQFSDADGIAINTAAKMLGYDTTRIISDVRPFENVSGKDALGIVIEKEGYKTLYMIVREGFEKDDAYAIMAQIQESGGKPIEAGNLVMEGAVKTYPNGGFYFTFPPKEGDTSPQPVFYFVAIITADNTEVTK